MKFWILALLLASPAFAQEPPAPAPVAKPVLSPDFQKGWCTGWAAASQAVVARRSLWRQGLETAAPPDKWPQALQTAAGAVDTFILVPALTGKITLADGSQIDCGSPGEGGKP